MLRAYELGHHSPFIQQRFIELLKYASPVLGTPCPIPILSDQGLGDLIP